MKMLASIVALLSAAATGAMAAAVPGVLPTPVVITATIVITATAGVTSFSGRCDHAYCETGTSYCFYWAGMTSYDLLSGPVPGEVRTTLGPCGSSTYMPAPKPTDP